MASAGYKWFVLGVVGVGTFMSALDGSVVNIVMPLIQRQYAATIGDVTWVSTAYLLAISSLLLIFGRLGDMLGYKGVFSAGFIIFGLGSLFAGLSPTLGWLVAARVLQGVGAAVLMALGPALITTSFLPTERGRALGLQATLTYTGLTVGPSLGGFIASKWAWHWVFLVNVPISIVGMALALILLHHSEPRGRQQFDLLGAALMACGLTAALLGLSEGETWGWQSPAVLALLAGGLALLVLFVRHEERTAHPMMPLGLFRSVAFSAGALAAFLQYTVVFMLTFLLPFYLQGLRNLPPETVGGIMTAQPVMMVLVAAASGHISDRVGPRGPASLGMAILAVALWLVSRAGGGISIPVLMVWLALVGLGSGLFTAPNNSAIMGAAPRERQGVAAGLLAVSRNVGMVTGIAVGGGLFAFLQGSALRHGLGADAAFVSGFERTLLAAAVLAALGGLVSVLRPGQPGKEHATAK